MDCCATVTELESGVEVYRNPKAGGVYAGRAVGGDRRHRLLGGDPVPCVGERSARARQTACLSNLSQIARAALMYAGDYDERLPLRLARRTLGNRTRNHPAAVHHQPGGVVLPGPGDGGPLCTDPHSRCGMTSRAWVWL